MGSISPKRRLNRGRSRAEHVDVLLVCNAGGHMLQLHSLRSAWEGRSCAWVSADKSDVRSLLADEPQVYFAHSPTVRNIPNLIRNSALAWRLLAGLRPKVVITTGAGMAVPFCWVARLYGARIAYVESFARVEAPSLTLRAIAPVADRIYVQWEELVDRVPGARYVGSVFSS